MNIKITALLSACLLMQAAHAQEVKKITMNEAVAMGLQSSKIIRIDDAKMEAAQASILEAKNRQLPDFNISGSYLRLGSAKINMAVKPNGQQAEGPKVNQALYGMANLSLPIYAGGRIRYGIQSAQFLAEAERFSAENDKEGIKYNVIQSYNNIQKAQSAIDILKENLAASLKRDSVFLGLENNGVLARNDRLKSQLRTADIELQLLDANNNFATANVNLNLLLGLPVTTLLELDSSYLGRINTIDNYENYEALALEKRYDVQALNMRSKAAAIGVKAAKAENLPAIALTGGYVAADIPKFLTVTNAINIGVGIQYNLGNLWKKNTSLMQANARVKELDANNELLTDNIRLQLNRDYQTALFSQRKISVLQKAVDQAAENYRITKNKYDNGLANVTDLLDADTALTVTKLNLINGLGDAEVAYKKLLLTTGTL